VLTVSTDFDEAFPQIDFPTPTVDELPPWATNPWYSLQNIEPSEESYVEIYENLRVLKQLGIDKLMVNHPAETWHDGEGASEFSIEAAPIKGGDDALSEYLDALDDSILRPAIGLARQRHPRVPPAFIEEALEH